MSPHEIEKLLGGYATDTLTDEERRTLFEAALGNQALFDVLGDEQALRELLQDAPSRAYLLAALREPRISPLARLAGWVRRPSVLALAAAVAAGIVTIAVVIPRKTVERPVTVAMSQRPRPEPAPLQPVPEGAPAPKRAPQKLSEAPRPAGPAKKDQPQRDAVVAQNGASNNQVQDDAPQPAPPPPAPAAAPAQLPPPPAEQAQAVQTKSAEAMRPAASSGYRMDSARKQAAAVQSARDLYYATQRSSIRGFMNQPRAKAKAEKFGGAAGVVGGVPDFGTARAGGVRYSILKRNLDGSFTEVDPATIFDAGDALRVRFETNQAGNLGVLERQSSGLWSLRMGARMQPGQPVQMPSESTIPVTAPGLMRFFVRFSHTLRSQANLDNITPTPNLLRESAGTSVYVVNPAWTPDAVLDFELTITSK